MASSDEEVSLHKPQIGVTGWNAEDGMGDLAHMLNAGETIRKNFPDYEVVYQIGWGLVGGGGSESGDKQDFGRLKALIDKLIFMKIIPPQEYQAKTGKDLLKEINEKNAGKIFLFNSKHYQGFENEGGDRFPDALFWVDASFPVFDMENEDRTKIRGGTFSEKESLYFLEHGEGAHFSYLIEKPRNVPEKNIHVMGFGDITCGDGKKRPTSGVFLEDHPKISAEEQALVLRDIQNQAFHQLLHGQDSLDKTKSQEIIADTSFLPCYFVRESGFNLVMLALQNLYPDKKCVMLTGKFKKEEVFDDKNLQKLKEAGYTSIEFLNAKEDKAAVEKRVLQEKEPKKVLKILSGAYFSEQDYLNLKKLPIDAVGCAGDNSLQDAIILGALPLFIPHHAGKCRVFSNLALVLSAHENAGKWKDAINFLKCYSEEAYKSGGGRFEEVMKKLSGQVGDSHDSKFVGYMSKELSRKPADKASIHYNAKVLAQWKEICQYLKKHHNTHDVLKQAVTEELKKHPQADSNKKKKKR